MECTGGKVYKPCGSTKGQPACGASVELPEDKTTCVEGCYCPEGTVVHDNKCITRDKCPCMLRGKSFAPGASVPKDCNTCTCTNGQWVCTQVNTSKFLVFIFESIFCYFITVCLFFVRWINNMPIFLVIV